MKLLHTPAVVAAASAIGCSGNSTDEFICEPVSPGVIADVLNAKHPEWRITFQEGSKQVTEGGTHYVAIPFYRGERMVGVWAVTDNGIKSVNAEARTYTTWPTQQNNDAARAAEKCVK